MMNGMSLIRGVTFWLSTAPDAGRNATAHLLRWPLALTPFQGPLGPDANQHQLICPQRLLAITGSIAERRGRKRLEGNHKARDLLSRALHSFV